MTPERPPDAERPRGGTPGAAHTIALAGDDSKAAYPAAVTSTGTVDRDRLDLGIRQVASVGSVLAASILGDPLWNLDDLDRRLAVLGLVDKASWNLTVATS